MRTEFEHCLLSTQEEHNDKSEILKSTLTHAHTQAILDIHTHNERSMKELRDDEYQRVIELKDSHTQIIAELKSNYLIQTSSQHEEFERKLSEEINKIKNQTTAQNEEFERKLEDERNKILSTDSQMNEIMREREGLLNQVNQFNAEIDKIKKVHGQRDNNDFFLLFYFILKQLLKLLFCLSCFTYRCPTVIYFDLLRLD